MLGQSILVALLVICVSAQEAPTNQLSRSTYLPDRSQSSWSSLPNSFNDNFDAIPHNQRTIGSSSLFRNQDSLLQKAGQSDSADLGSLNFHNPDSSSFLRNQGSLLEPGGVPVSPYRAEPYSIGSSLSGSRFMDTTMRGQDMLNGNSWMNRNGMVSPRGLNMPNLQTPRNRGLSGFPSDGSSSVLDGSSLGDGVSGFSRSTPWDMSRGTRPLNAFPFQYSESRNLNVPPLSIGQRRGTPWRLLNSQSFRGGMGQLGLNRDSGLGFNRFNMQREIPTGQFNLLGDLGVNRPINSLMTPSRRLNNNRRMDEIWVLSNRGGASLSRGSDNNNRLMDEISIMNNRGGASLGRSSGKNGRIMDHIWVLRNRGGQSSRSLPQNGMIPMSRSAPLTTLPSTSQGSSLFSGLGPRTAMGRSSNMGRLSSSNLATAPLRSTSLTQTSLTPTTGRVSPSLTSSLIRGISSGPLSSGTTVYQPSSGGQRQGIRRLSAF